MDSPLPETPPTFGLLVPCRNGAPFLSRLFASARAQTRAFDEIWLFDDGSDDGSGALAGQSGARVLRSDRTVGPSAARNRLIAACGCRWLHFHDVDDIMDPRYLERVAAHTAPGVEVVVCNMVWLNEGTGGVDNRWTYDAAALARDPVSYLVRNTVGGINGLYRREALLAVGGFDESLRYWEDLDLNLRLSRRTRPAVVPEELVTAFRRRASYSNANLGEVWRVKLHLMARLLADATPAARTTLAAEAEAVAGRLAALGCWRDVPAALALARRAGGNPPTTRHPGLRLLKRIVPAATAFRLQWALHRILAR